MPAMLEDPTAPAIYRNPADLNQYTMPVLPDEILPRCVTLRDRQTNATIIPFNSPDLVPYSLLAYLCDQLNREIEKGDTYPHTDALPLETFGPYWFANFGAVMVLGELEGPEDVRRKAEQGVNWDKQCLGSFYIKPNYPGRSSHICNGGFLVTDGARNRGVGRLMGESYLEWAPKLVLSMDGFSRMHDTDDIAGLHILRLQPCLRDQYRFATYLGHARLQAYWPGEGCRSPQITTGAVDRRYHIRSGARWC